MAATFWVQAKFADAIASQLKNLPASAVRLAQLDRSFDKPAVILSAGTAPANRRTEHAAMAARMAHGEYVLAERRNHWIMQDQPELLLRAIETVVEQIRAPAGSSLVTNSIHVAAGGRHGAKSL